MLKVRCTTSELEGDDFVGLRFEDNQPKVVFPRGYALSDSDDEVRKDIIRLLSTILKYKDKYQGEEIRGEFSHCLRVEPAALHALCGVIEWLQPHRRELHGLCVVDVGVCDVCATVENGGFAKDYISLSEFVFGLHEFYSLEPYKVDKTCTVGEVSHKPARGSLAHLFEAAYLAAELNMGLPAVYFAYFEETAAIDIFIWEIVQEVVQGIYFQFSVEERCTLFAYSGKIFYVSGCCVKHSTIAFASTKSNGVVILIFSRLPSTMCTNSPIASTTEASSVNCSR